MTDLLLLQPLLRSMYPALLHSDLQAFVKPETEREHAEVSLQQNTTKQEHSYVHNNKVQTLKRYGGIFKDILNAPKILYLC